MTDTPAPVTDANERIGSWLSAALDDPKVCDAMKADINDWFAMQAAKPVVDSEVVEVLRGLHRRFGTMGHAGSFSGAEAAETQATIAALLAKLEPKETGS